MYVERTEFLRVTAEGRKNQEPDKPYEDAFWSDPRSRVFCIADGITRSRRIDGSYPNPSPASTVADLVVSTVASLFSNESPVGDTERCILEAFQIANKNIQNYLRNQHGNGNSLETEIPAAVATLLAFEGNFALFAHLGDCAVLRFRQGNLLTPERLTADQTASARKWLTETSSMCREAKLDTLRHSIRNKSDHPLAFGVLSGELEGLHFIQTGRSEAVPGDLFLICSDGLDAVLANLETDPHIRELIALRDVEKVIDYAEQLDLRLGRRSDDKTLLLIDVLG